MIANGLSPEFRASTRARTSLPLVLVLCTLALNVTASADEPAIISFDAPGAGTSPGASLVTPLGTFFLPQGTFPYGINGSGAIGGNFQDAHNVLHGFLRTPEGEFITFDAPGAGTGALQGTQGFAISPRGVVVGKTFDANSVQHGMLRTREGAVTVFDAPGAGMTASQGTFATNVNARGAVAGSYVDVNNLGHGFVRARDGSIAAIDAPGASQGTFLCIIDCLADDGTVVGDYTDAGTVAHGFLRTPDGVITTIDVPEAGTSAFQGTFPTGINEEGTIVGGYTDANYAGHGFVRAHNGTVTTFDVPAASPGAFQGTVFTTATINDAGVITGNYADANNVSHGFIRDRDGTITTFDAPGAGTCTASGAMNGTFPLGINPPGAITGYYLDATCVGHGFLRTGQRADADSPAGDDPNPAGWSSRDR
jgi:hypothetical protein